MSLDEDKLELLIGKCLDGQATSIEQHLIEKEMNQNPKAKELFEKWQTLNTWGRELVVNDIVGQGARPEDIFEKAWQRSRGFSWVHLVRAERRYRFAVGMAAGLVLGVILHFTLVWTNGTTGIESPSRRGLVAGVQPGGDRQDVRMTSATSSLSPQAENRKVDLYTFTDNAGNRYLVRRPQESKVRTASYCEL
jgi:hypothetical protein